MNPKTLTLSLVPILALCVLPMGATGPVELAITPGEHVGAAALSESGTSWVSLTNNSRRASRLLRIAPSGSVEELSLPHWAVNQIETSGPDKLWIGAADESGYGWRLVELTADGPRVRWDSRDLGTGWNAEEAQVQLSPDGRWWAAVRPEGEALRMAVGRIDSHRPSWTSLVDHATVDTGKPRPHAVTDDFPGLAWLTTRPVPVIAVAHQGLVSLHAADDRGLLAFLDTDQPPHSITWHRQDSTLWVHGAGTFTAFEVPESLLRSRSPRTEPSRIPEGARLDQALLGFVPEQLRSLDTDLVVSGQQDGRARAALVVGASLAIRELPVTGGQSLIGVSGGGERLLVLPDGPASDRALLSPAS